MSRRTFIAAVVLAVVVSTPALAKTIKYPGDFDNPNDAIAAAGKGDKVIIAADWAGQVDVIDKDGIQIVGKKKAVISGVSAHPGLNIVNCQNLVVTGLRIEDVGHGVTVRDSEDCVLKSLQINSASEHGIAVGSSRRVTIQKCQIAKCDTDGINLDTDLTGTAPDDCIVTKNQVAGVGDDGIDATGKRHIISKNQIAAAGSNGINIDKSPTEPMTIEKNRITTCGSHGIHLQTPGHTALKNRIDDVGDDGIRVDGNDGVVVKNKIRDTIDDGIDVEGENNLIEKNSIKDPGGDGIDADGDNCTYVKNKVTGAGDDGVEVESSGSVYEKNNFSGNEDHGIVVQEGQGNRFTSNTAKKNLDDDIWTDHEDQDQNTWEKNKYKTGNIRP